jgi:transposase
VQLKDILKENRQWHGKVTKRVLFLHDNAPAHRALTTQKKMAYLGGFLRLDHPPYSPDPGAVSLQPVPWTENQLKSRHFSSVRETG